MPPIIIKDLKIEKNVQKPTKTITVKNVLNHPEWKTESLPLGLVQNIMDLHNEANPDAVKRFALKFLEKKSVGERFIKDVLAKNEADLSLDDPKQMMQAFYKYSFLMNEEANSLIIYSCDGKLLASALVGSFAKDDPARHCSISNLSISKKATSHLHSFVLKDLSTECEAIGEKPSLITNCSLAKAYEARGFTSSDTIPFSECVRLSKQ